MVNATVPPPPEFPTESPPPDTCPTRCPLCGGTMIEGRNTRRCMRCSWSICDGCEGGPEIASAHAEVGVPI